jgi:hypothetical protein
MGARGILGEVRADTESAIEPATRIEVGMLPLCAILLNAKFLLLVKDNS